MKLVIFCNLIVIAFENNYEDESVKSLRGFISLILNFLIILDTLLRTSAFGTRFFRKSLSYIDWLHIVFILIYFDFSYFKLVHKE
jgi:hypothetical protein